MAGATGAFLRFGFWIGLPWSLQAANVRHAHSHLMYFSWATPAVIALLGPAMSERNGRPLARTGVEAPGWSALLLGLATYPFFLLAGYGPVPLFGASLPLASILSGLTIFAWYAFAAWYAFRRRGAPRTRSRLLWDVALFGLLLSTLGAWGRAGLQIAGVEAPNLEDLAVFLFLGAFSEGWLLLGLLGFAFLEREDKVAGGWAHLLLWIGLPWASLLGTGVFAGWGNIGNTLEYVMRAGGFLFLAGLGIHARELVRHIRRERRYEWAPFLIFFLAHLGMQAGLLVPSVADWGERLGLRVLYLHVLALGAVSCGLFAAARERWGRGASPSPWSFGVGVLVLLAGLVVLASPLLLGTGGVGRRAVAAWTSIAPLLPPAVHALAAFCSRAKTAWRSPGRIEM